MEASLRVQLDILAATANRFARANERRSKEHDWMTLNEGNALADLRAQLAMVDREASKIAKAS